MNRAWLMAAPLAAALLLGGWQYWPSADATAPSPQHAGPASPLVRQTAPPSDKSSLQARHEAFLAAEGSLTVPTDPRLASLQKLFDEREQLRRQRFTPVEQEQLFAEDRLMEQWTLRRKALAESSDADKPLLASELELWLAEQPQWFREAEANSRLLGDLQALEQLPAAGRDAALREQLGPEAADRLHQLAESQQGFEQQLAGYLAEIRPLPAEARVSQQPEILARWFEPGQWRRVEALTRLTLGEQ